MQRMYFGRLLYSANDLEANKGMLNDKQCGEFFHLPLTYSVLHCETLDILAKFLIDNRNERGFATA